jgi:dihydrolipoamide dehydrogenase
VSIGRRPNLDRLHLDRLGVELDAQGIPRFDPHTMQIGNLPIFIAGDTAGDRAILHEAGDEGKIAGYNAARETVTAFRRKPPLAITFCDPNIVSVGASWAALEDRDDVAVGEMRLGPVGRALIMGKNRGVIRVYAEKHTGKLLGAALVSPRGENLGHLLAWSIQQGLTVYDLIRMPYYHPVIEEALQAALYDLLGKLEHKPAGLLELAPLEA